MTISKRLAALRSATAAAASADDEDTPLPARIEDEDEGDENCESKPAKDKDMTEEELNAAKAQAKAEGFDEANARFAAVLGSEHYAGRETLAKTLLANAKLGADEINAALASAPVAAAAPTAHSADAEEGADSAARETMAAAIAQNKNADIDAGGGDLAPTSKAQQILNDQAAFTGRKAATK